MYGDSFTAGLSIAFAIFTIRQIMILRASSELLYSTMMNLFKYISISTVIIFASLAFKGLLSVYSILSIIIFATAASSGISSIHYLSKNIYSSCKTRHYNKKFLGLKLILFALVMPLIFILVSSIFINPFEGKRRLIIGLILVLSPIKFICNCITKAGDVIDDYQNKIVQDNKEDVNETAFSTIDNIGDIIGDLFGCLVESINILLIFYLFASSNGAELTLNHVGLAMGKFMFFVGMLALSVSYNPNVMKYIDYFFMTSMFCYTIIDAVIMSKVLGLGHTSFITLWISNSFYGIMFIFITFITKVISNAISSRYTKNVLKDVLTNMSVNYNLLVLFGSGAVAHIIITIINLLVGLYLKAKPMYKIYTTSFMYECLLIYLCFFLFKSSIGSLSDSTAGLLRKQISSYENSDDKNDEDLAVMHQAEADLEAYDVMGNSLKMEFKIFLFIITSIIYEGIMKMSFKIAFVNDSVLYYGVIVFLGYLFTINLLIKDFKLDKYKNQSLANQIKHVFYTISTYGTLIFASIVVALYNIAIYSAKVYKYIPYTMCGAAWAYLFMALVFSIAGGISDIIKKDVENDENASVYDKKEAIKQDIAGDYYKDVLAPLAINISNIIAIGIATNKLGIT